MYDNAVKHEWNSTDGRYRSSVDYHLAIVWLPVSGEEPDQSETLQSKNATCAPIAMACVMSLPHPCRPPPLETPNTTPPWNSYCHLLL